MTRTTASIIIPVKPGGRVAALAPLSRLDWPADDWEVMVVEGSCPSRQRNRAAAVAGGEIVWFLDDDSRVRPDALRRLADHFADPAVAAVGGPSLTPATDSPWQRSLGAMLASPLGGGGVRNRYRRTGEVRRCRQNELILCNLAFRRDLFLADGGLDERLYPNEENELMDRLVADGHRLLHDPDLCVERSQRPDWRAFVRQMVGYGRGRGEQTRIAGVSSPVNFAPLGLLCWLLLAPAMPAVVALPPILLYSALVVLSAVTASPSVGARRIPLLALLTVAMHLLYGGGIAVGLLRPRYRQRRPGEGEVTLRQVKGFGEEFPAGTVTAGSHECT
jgi:cellulose synthase/poly-beta-1,6-N-acetylglucosamine synthase-like glycosyltransferase